MSVWLTSAPCSISSRATSRWPFRHANNRGEYPLFLACYHGHADIARLLTEHDVDVGQASNSSSTPLLVACYYGHVDVVRLLIERNADVSQAANNGDTPLFVSLSYGHNDEIARYVDITRLLLRGGADIHRATSDGATPLSRARELSVADCARERTAAYLVLQAAAPWSPATHAVRSTATRARAVELVRVGRLLSTSDTSLTPGIRAWLGSPAGRTFWLRVIAAVI